MNICVFASSSDIVDNAYHAAAYDLGQAMGAAGHTLIYGGGRFGLMGAVARGTQETGGQVVGILPEKLTEQALETMDEMIVTATMHERKALMVERSDAVVCLPGGFGTLEEVIEVITLKQLGYIDSAIVFVNTSGFFDKLVAVFDTIFAEKFADPVFSSVYEFVPDPAAALAYLADYTPPVLPTKWIATSKEGK